MEKVEVKDSVQSPHPTATGECGKQDCLVCKGGTQNSLCRKSNVKVIGCFKDSFSRQISEGVHIRRSSYDVLNSKAEWHQPALWRVRNELTTD